ncbi:hypothetical protein EV183_004195 [Coemansia sp. RSA 2336]|nr:hypothetical protein EV183_004195 [Coemansia sp. RSA 2336]
MLRSGGLAGKLKQRRVACHHVHIVPRTIKRGYAAPKHNFAKYDPKVVESDWYDWWEKRGLFKPQRGNEFTMLLPPPNVTGVLHIGHALTLSIQDAIARWNRMHGRSVNWVPGTDHAGISMQTVVEKKLKRETGQSRHDLGREEFLAKVWEWKKQHGDRIKQQTVRIGASLNWSDEYFTMDPKHSQVVRDAFIKLYDDGLIYRTTKMVNWSCALQSVISDIEVDKLPTEGRVLLQVPDSKSKVEFGVLHSVEFQVVDPPGCGPRAVRVETTRPETMLGDVALAINSSDARYKGLAGRMAMHPLLKQKIPIICDDVLVNPDFGTGVVKITPAHDVDDYACAQRHGLPVVPVFAPNGTVAQHAALSEYAGMSRWQARKQVVAQLTAANAYTGKRDAEQSVISQCSRSGDVIEPMLMPQWYVSCKELARKANEMVHSGAIKLVPERQRAVWHGWLSGIEDWCVSRQLWWGHRIPVYCVAWDKLPDSKVWVAAESASHAERKAAAQLSPEQQAAIAGSSCTVVQDEDVLDTWFSSGLLPLTVFGAEHSPLKPANTISSPDMQALSTVLETGQDILFFWVARMAMLCTYFAKVPPFSDVLLHPMVRDAQGRKMSKSLGNIIDPMDVIDGAALAKLQETLQNGYLAPKELGRSMRELKQLYPQGFQAFGADALRLALLIYTQQTQQINMSIDSVKASYHFCNKLWNTFRFAHMHAEKLGISYSADGTAFSDIEQGQLTVFDRALLSRLHGMLGAYQRAMATYRLAVAAERVRDFVQRDLCDRYIEVSKLALFGHGGATNQNPHVAVRVLLGALDVVLRALHPFMPFISEELWQHHARRDAGEERSVMECEWGALGGLEALHDRRSEEENDARIRSLKQQHAPRLESGAPGSSRLAIEVTVPKRQAAASGQGTDVDRGVTARTLEMATKHQACIALMSKEPAIRICSASENSISDGRTAVAMVTAHMRVTGRLAASTRPAEAASAAAVARLEAELAKVRQVAASAGYVKNAPDAVKAADSVDTCGKTKHLHARCQMLRPNYEFCDPAEYHGTADEMEGLSFNLPMVPTYVQHRTKGRLEKYVLEMAQHPIRARMCGFGEKDRRPLDPPPVVRLRVRDEQGEFMQSEDVEIWKFVVSASLWAPHTENDRSIVINPNTLPSSVPVYQSSSAAASVMSLSEPVKVRNLVGTTVSNAYLLKDHNDQLSIFFIFHDLSVRTEGQFRLKFQFSIIPSEDDPRAFVESVAWSNVFEVYSAKTFPGMTDSTELSKAFAAQGIKITIRKNTRARPYLPRPDDDDPDDPPAIR